MPILFHPDSHDGFDMGWCIWSTDTIFFHLVLNLSTGGFIGCVSAQKVWYGLMYEAGQADRVRLFFIPSPTAALLSSALSSRFDIDWYMGGRGRWPTERGGPFTQLILKLPLNALSEALYVLMQYQFPPRTSWLWNKRQKLHFVQHASKGHRHWPIQMKVRNLLQRRQRCPTLTRRSRHWLDLKRKQYWLSRDDILAFYWLPSDDGRSGRDEKVASIPI